MAKISGIVGALALGVGASQFPELSQQYRQRLGGAVDALQVVVADFDASARDAGLSRIEALAAYQGSTFLEQRGVDIQKTIVRYETLVDDLAALENASAFERLRNFKSLTDSDILRRTWQAFVPAVPISAEGGIFTLGGGFLGYIGVSGLFSMVFWRRRRAV